jgi:hypothetical protein
MLVEQGFQPGQFTVSGPGEDPQVSVKKKNDHGCAPWSFREPIALKT